MCNYIIQFMNIKLVSVGKTDDRALEMLIQNYIKRLTRYINFEFTVIPDLKNRKNTPVEKQKQQEGDLLLAHFEKSDFVILLDEKGTQFSSVGFSTFIQKKMLSGIKRLVFVIGGPYGFSDAVYQRANQKISFSKMTFSHQMVRLFFVEQLYRAFTIIRNEPYHHE